MSITSLFEKLGAPLKNTRWSWGAAHSKSGVVFLRVWQDETRNFNGKHIVRITDRKRFEGTSDLGYAERKEHIELLASGRRGYAIFCVPRKPISIPRELESAIEDKLFPTGDIIELEGDLWLQYFGSIKLTEFL